MQEFGAEVGQGFVSARPNIRPAPNKAQKRPSWDGICYKWLETQTGILDYCFKYWLHWYCNSERFKNNQYHHGPWILDGNPYQSVFESIFIVMFKCIQQYLSYPSIIKMKIEERDSNWDFPRIIFCLNSLHSLSLSNRMPYKGTFGYKNILLCLTPTFWPDFKLWYNLC